MRVAPGDVAPLAERIARHLADSLDRQPRDAPDALHVLVVDDSAALRRSVCGALGSAGHRVTEAAHGLEAVGRR